jgi:hypothetical protein
MSHGALANRPSIIPPIPSHSPAMALDSASAVLELVTPIAEAIPVLGAVVQPGLETVRQILK